MKFFSLNHVEVFLLHWILRINLFSFHLIFFKISLVYAFPCFFTTHNKKHNLFIFPVKSKVKVAMFDFSCRFLVRTLHVTPTTSPPSGKRQSTKNDKMLKVITPVPGCEKNSALNKIHSNDLIVVLPSGLLLYSSNYMFNVSSFMKKICWNCYFRSYCDEKLTNSKIK